MNTWITLLTQLRQSGTPCVLVSIARTRGSTPREAGARMLVSRDQSFGTIGGGQLELECTRMAALMLAADASIPTTRRFTLGAECGQCCGGVVEVWFECVDYSASWVTALTTSSSSTDAALVTLNPATEVPSSFLVDPNNPTETAAELLHAVAPLSTEQMVHTLAIERDGIQTPALVEMIGQNHFDVVIFGAGHVGSALINVLVPCNAAITVVDSRPDKLAQVAIPGVCPVLCVNPHDWVEKICSGAFVLVMTHSHAQDLQICAQLLQRTDLSFCGLIGSHSKRRQFERRLRRSGLEQSTIDDLVCPIGVADISGKRPGEIAVAVAAQLLSRREAATALGADDKELNVIQLQR